jgi:inorganic pyrophosphatase
MSSSKQRRSALADPATFEPFARKPKSSTSGTAKPGEELLQVVIETPRGSRNKYSFDPEQRTFRLKTLLPVGMVFPYDFGFIPKTTGGDGDPFDILVLMDEPAFPGCTVLVRLLGVLQAEQIVQRKTERNDRLLAVAEPSLLFANLKEFDDLPRPVLKEIEEFFNNYHRLRGKQSRTLDWQHSSAAMKLIEQARRRYRQK